MELLGLYPTLEGLVVQGLTVVVLAVGFARASKPASDPTKPAV